DAAGTGATGADAEAAALRTATQLAAGLIRVCSQSTPEGALFPVDPSLRPEGRNGPLVRTMASHRAYYGRWAQTWEFQALLKARPVAGDAALGDAYAQAIGPLVWLAGHLRRRRPGDAARGGRHAARRRGGPGTQAGARRAAGHRVRRAASSARARPGRPGPAGAGHAARAGRPRRWRVRRPARRDRP